MKRLLRNYGDILRVRAVRVVLVASAVSVAGDAAAMVALLLRVQGSDAGPWAVSLLLLAFAVPVIATMGVAGALADRADPRRVLLVTALVQAVAAVGLAAVDGLGATVAFVLVLQTAFALGNPAWTAVVPRLVPDGEAGRVVGLQQALRGITGPIGAGVGGVLVQWRGPSTALLADALTFLALAWAAVALPKAVASAADRDPDVVPIHTGGGVLGRVLPRDGVAALRARPVVAVLVVALLPLVVTLESVNAVEVLLVRDTLGASPAQFGLVETAAGGAAVLGALLSGVATGRTARVRMILAAMAVVALLQLGQGLAPAYLVYLALAAAAGLCLGVVNSLVFAVVLDEVEPDRRGAVVALVSGISRAAGALALGLGGTVGTVAGPRATYLLAGGLGLVVAVVATLAVARVNRSVDGGSTGRASHDAPAPATLEV